jgi:hypothetical protein
LSVLAASTVTACRRTSGAPEIGVSTRPDNVTGRIEYAFDSLDARPVSSGAARGRPAVLVFMTTWDLSSQAQIDYLVPMAKRDADGVFYAAVALQEDKDREILEVYKAQLQLSFPVALADKEIIAGRGPFGDVHAVPTTVILDREGRMVWRHIGLAKPEEIRAGLKGL